MTIYEGNEPYVFISYSHKDRKKVMPVVEKLQADGCRVWFDEGIEAGSEWPETVAGHLKDCGLFIAFITASYLDSFNCRREIDYAVSKRKSFIAVMLEEVQMTPGMEMQLSSVQFLNRFQMDAREFYDRLIQSELIRPCIADGEEREDAAEPAEEMPERKKKKLGVKKIAAIVAGVLAAAGLLFLLGWNLTHITIAGTRYMFNEEYLTIKDTSLTPGDTQKLRRFTNLALLSFENCDFTEDSENNLSYVKNGVRSFSITDCTGIENFGWLSGMKSVKWLYIKNSGFNDESADEFGLLFGMNGLVGLDLSDNKDFSNLGGVMSAAGSELQQIHLANTGVSNLSSLRDCEDLWLLDIEGCNVETLEPLQDLKELTYINANNNKLKSLEGLGGMVNLDTLSACGNGLESIEEIRECTKLERIDLSDNKISDVSPLEKSRVVITQLLLENNNISDMSMLTGMNSLKLLSIDGNALEDLSFLKGSDELQTLSARNNRISSIDAISSMKGIDVLYLSDNQIEGDIFFDEDFGTWNKNNYSGSAMWDIQLQHNKISSVNFSNKLPWRLAVYDNPLEHITGPGGAEGVYGGEDSVEYTEPGEAVFKTGGHTLVIEDYREPIARTGVLTGIEQVYLSWDAPDDAMMDMISGFDTLTSLHISGCPLDNKTQVEDLVYGADFTSVEEMDKALDAEREKRIDIFL